VAGYVPIQIDQFSSFSRVLTIKDSMGNLQNLVGFYANTQIRKSYYSLSSNTIITTISDAANGQITLSMDASNTATLTPGRYVYDVVTTANNGIRTRLLEGIVVVNPGSTH
jgi:hypothetical protein